MRRLAVAMPERRCLRDRAPWALEARRMVPGRSLKAAESATLIQVSHPRRLPSESIRKRIDRLVLGHPDWTACCEAVRGANSERVRPNRGAGVTELASSFWAPESGRTPDLALATEPAGLR